MLTDLDKIFFGILRQTSEMNTNTPPKNRRCLKLAKTALSEEALKILGIDTSTGGWYGNVYIQFIPSIITARALTWQGGEEDQSYYDTPGKRESVDMLTNEYTGKFAEKASKTASKV